MEPNNVLLNNQQFIVEIKDKIIKYLEPNENENTMIKKNLWEAAKAILRGKFVAI